ncbi:MAG: transglutaminase domain-containing protein, partial [Planctomycetales bacterium]|nr:transglutaminase domain-containing protein [Planctomycetales bacterium]
VTSLCRWTLCHTRVHAICMVVIVCVFSCSCQKRGPNFSYAKPTSSGIDLLWADEPPDDAASRKTLWYAHYVNNSKIGQRKFVVHDIQQQEQTIRRLVSSDHLETMRFAQRNVQDLTQASIETHSGSIHSFGYELTSGQTTTRVEGIVRGNKVDVTRNETMEPAERFSMGWPPNGPSIFAIEQSLWNKPMTPDEAREVLVYRPLQGAMTRVTLSVTGQEVTQIGTQEKQLIRIESQNAGNEDLSAVSVLWVNDAGTIEKIEYPFMNRTMVLVTESEANALNRPYDVDLGFGNVVETEVQLAKDKFPAKAVYMITSESIPAEKLFWHGLGQEVKVTSGGTLFMRVTAVQPDSPSIEGFPQTPPTDQEKIANSLVDCEDHRVKAFVDAVATRGGDSWKTAKALESAIFEQLDKTETTQVFDAAGQVVEKRSGDCSEHAVLLAAACRNYGIPARVVVGLVFDKERKGFLYHMWNEVWITDRWIPLDATVGQGRVGADHIKFHHSSLAGQSPYNIVTPIMNAIGRLQIKISGVKYGQPQRTVGVTADGTGG